MDKERDAARAGGLLDESGVAIGMSLESGKSPGKGKRREGERRNENEGLT